MWENIISSGVAVLVGLLVTAIFNGIINFPKKKKQIKDDLNLFKRAIQVLLKNDLKVRYDYWLSLGYAPEDAKDDLEQEYIIYHGLGKNGVMDERRAKVLKLPTEPPEEE